MRHFTIQHIRGLLEKAPKLQADRRPLAMPGKKWPTRVAWSIKLADFSHDAHGRIEFKSFRTLEYIGKPNRLRALEARNFIRQAKKPGTLIFEMFQATFDRAGLLAYVLQKYNKQKFMHGCGAFTAYHPHIPPPQVEIVEAFVKPLHVKYVGGHRLYSQKKHLKVEELDAYYEWYLKQFRRRLRRPKPVAMSVIAGELMDPEGQPLEAPAQEPEVAEQEAL
jgi:hypothetical protein